MGHKRFPPTPWTVVNIVAKIGSDTLKEEKPGSGNVFVDADGMVVWPQEHAEAIVAAINAYHRKEAE